MTFMKSTAAIRAASTAPPLFTRLGDIDPSNAWIDDHYNLMPAEGLVLLVAPGGAGKSTLLAQLAFALATGGPYIGRPGIGDGEYVGIVAAEGAQAFRRALVAQSRHVGGEAAERAAEAVMLLEGDLNLADPNSVRSFINRVKTVHWMRRPRAWFLDSFSFLVGGQNPLDHTVAAAAVRGLQTIVRELGRLVVLACHAPKSGAMEVIGSSLLPAAADHVLHLVVRGQSRRLVVGKSRVLTPGVEIRLRTATHAVRLPDGEDAFLAEFHELVEAGEGDDDAGEPTRGAATLRKGLPRALWEEIRPDVESGASVTVEAVREAASRIAPGLAMRHRSTRVKEALEALVRAGLIAFDGETVSPPSPAPAPICTDPPSLSGKGGKSVQKSGAAGSAPPAPICTGYAPYSVRGGQLRPETVDR
jgi:hypothetical protein